jgi:hypothetical protein
VTQGSGGGHGASMRSWLVCLVIVAGFVVGGLALVFWNWPVFWAGVGIVVVGSLMGWAVNIMDEVTEYGGGHSAGGDPSSSSY